MINDYEKTLTEGNLEIELEPQNGMGGVIFTIPVNWKVKKAYKILKREIKSLASGRLIVGYDNRGAIKIERIIYQGEPCYFIRLDDKNNHATKKAGYAARTALHYLGLEK